MTTSVLDWRALRAPSVLWASAFGVGFLRPAPGTWGSAAAVLVWWFAIADLVWWVQVLICAIYGLTAWWSSAAVVRRYAIADAPQIVADEVIGMWLALLVCPQEWWAYLGAFVLFRLFDVAKPGPVGWLDRNVHGGLGVILDDVVAGVFAGVALTAVLWLFRAVGIIA